MKTESKVLLLTAIIILSLFVPIVNADGAGVVSPTDIRAYINGFEINVYNLNGNAMIKPDDLTNYGFDGSWNNDDRRIDIVRNPGKTVQSIASAKDSGQYNILESNIKVFMCGIIVPSVNADGTIMIPFDTLGMFGTEVWKGDLNKLYCELGSNTIPNALPYINLGIDTGYVFDLTDSQINDAIWEGQQGMHYLTTKVLPRYKLQKPYVDGMDSGYCISSASIDTPYYEIVMLNCQDDYSFDKSKQYVNTSKALKSVSFTVNYSSSVRNVHRLYSYYLRQNGKVFRPFRDGSKDESTWDGDEYTSVIMSSFALDGIDVYSPVEFVVEYDESTSHDTIYKINLMNYK